MRALRFALLGALATGAVACSDALNVVNPNAPDRNRALARPSDVEALIGGAFQGVHNGTLGGFCALNTQALTMSMESYSNLANNNMGPRAAIPRSPVDNSRGNAVAGSNYRDWLVLNRAARQAAVGLAAVNAAGFTFFPASASQKARAQAQAHFTLGAALGNIALMYDQGGVINWTDNGNDPTPAALVPFDSLMRFALAEFDSAMHYDTIATAAQLSGIGALNWMGNPGLNFSSVDSAVAFARGYKARFRAEVNRDAAGRAMTAAQWNLVIADATAFLAKWPNGIIFNMNPSQSWDIGWMPTIFQSDQQSWSMMWTFMVGMADTSTAGNYNAWLNTANASKAPFLIVTSDKRFPSGNTRAAQQGPGCPGACTAGQGSTTAPMQAGVYIRNRAGADWNGDPYANSWYDHERWANFVRVQSRIGPFPVMPAAEIRMLRAEGYIRTGQFDLAAADINVTRVPNGLGSVPNGLNGASIIGSGNTCVPKVPLLTAQATGTVSCPTMMEAMKWEKRMETQWTAPYGFFLDNRGWGDLPGNTATMWPLPYQEIDTRILFPNPPPYVGGYGGGLANSSPLASTYGLK